MLTKNTVTFRAWEEEDDKFLFEWLNDRDARFYLDSPFPCTSKEQVKTYMNQRKNEPYRYMILSSDNQLPIGTCRLFNIDLFSRRCEFSLMIGDATYRRKGYGYNSLDLLKDVAFLGLCVNRLELHCFEENIGAVKLYKRSGFQVDGILREYQFLMGKPSNMLIMSMLANQFFKKQ
jgi:RimJ/RimL family protein N-acetyltransferase